MPFDMSPAKDDLSDIDVSKPLSVKSIRRIVRATRQAGLLAMDDPTPHLLRLTLDPTETIFFSPHQAVDAFLGAEHRESCPCHLGGAARDYLTKLNNVHRSLVLYRSIAPVRAQLEDQFSQLLDGKLPAEPLEPFWDFGGVDTLTPAGRGSTLPMREITPPQPRRPMPGGPQLETAGGWDVGRGVSGR